MSPSKVRERTRVGYALGLAARGGEVYADCVVLLEIGQRVENGVNRGYALGTW